MDTQQASLQGTILYVCLAVGILSLLLTALNLLALYGGFLATLRAAPAEIPEVLGAVRDQLLEERDALRLQARELRQKRALAREARRAPHPAHAGRPRSSSRNRGGGTGGGAGGPPGMLGPNSRSASSTNLRGGPHTLTHAEMTLGQHYMAVRELYRRFRVLERPFVVVVPTSGGGGGGGQRQAAREQAGAGVRVSGAGAAWGPEEDLPPAGATTTTAGEKAQQASRDDLEMQAEMPASGPAWYRSGFLLRFLWWQSKGEVLKVADGVQKIALRRMEREVTSCRMMLKQIRDGGEGPEDLASPLLEGGFGFAGPGGAFATGGRNDSHGPSPLLGMRRRPVGETSNVYESSEESDSSAMAARMKYRPDERPLDPRIRVSEGRRRNSPGWEREPPRGDGHGPPRGDGHGPPRYAGDGWRQSQFPRIVEVPSNERHPPLALDVPRASRSRSRPGYGYDGPHSPYDARR